MKLTLKDNHRFPALGMGLWKLELDIAAERIYQAIQMGYRHLDAACDYGNEPQVGDGIARALADGLCSRDQLWVTSKLWNTYHAPEHVRPAVERSLSDLKLDYLDLYLIHFPIPLQFVPFEKRYPPGWFFDPHADAPQMKPVSIPLSETWQAMEELVDAGLVKHIGLSNCNIALIREILAIKRIHPSVLQVESHPYLTQEKLLRFCEMHCIAVTAFSPIGAISYLPLGMAKESDSVLAEPIIQKIAGQLGKSEAQVVLRWGMQRGTAVIPKASQIAHLKENFEAQDFELSAEQMAQISALNRNQRFNDPGVFCEQAFNTFFPIFE